MNYYNGIKFKYRRVTSLQVVLHRHLDKVIGHGTIVIALVTSIVPKVRNFVERRKKLEFRIRTVAFMFSDLHVIVYSEDEIKLKPWIIITL